MRKIDKKRLRRALPGIVLGSVLFVFSAIVVGFAARYLSGDVKAQKKVVQVQLFRPPPPPQKVEQPPPPPPEEKLPEPKPSEDAPDVPNLPGLGLDAEGVAGSDAFGLVGRKGGQDLLASDSRFKSYAVRIKDEVLDHLSANRDVRTANYSVVVSIWIGVDGKLGHCDLVGTSGNFELDNKLKLALADIGKFPEAPPDGMPQPVRLRIQSRA